MPLFKHHLHRPRHGGRPAEVEPVQQGPDHRHRVACRERRGKHVEEAAQQYLPGARIQGGHGTSAEERPVEGEP